MKKIELFSSDTRFIDTGEDLIGALPKKELTPKESNRLQIEQQILKIRMLENALEYSYKGESYLCGQRVYASTLAQAKNELAELDRLRGVYEQKKLPYFNSPGSLTEKIKDHYENDGNIVFTEFKNGSTGKRVQVHIKSIGRISKQIKKQQMAQKKKVKVAAKKKAAAPKEKAGGPTVGSRVSALVDKGYDNEKIIATFGAKKWPGTENSIRWYASKARAGSLV